MTDKRIPRKKGQRAMKEDMPTMNTGAIPDPKATAMGPRIKTQHMHDKRRKKNQLPILLKRFRKYIEDNEIR